ncbi:hypothetical protein ACFOHW_10535 [Paenibacillus abyssi]|uniref:hypothetical protein n=1 Tax=Paenibacillus abyssi TaxID=1340531 RepID=UPI003616AD01
MEWKRDASQIGAQITQVEQELLQGQYTDGISAAAYKQADGIIEAARKGRKQWAPVMEDVLGNFPYAAATVISMNVNNEGLLTGQFYFDTYERLRLYINELEQVPDFEGVTVRELNHLAENARELPEMANAGTSADRVPGSVYKLVVDIQLNREKWGADK